MFRTDDFLSLTTSLYALILDTFGSLFSISALLFLVLCVVIYFSPLAKVTLGGKGAQPLLTKWRWFSIVLCTTIATGILFWGTAEPLFHLHSPPESLGISPNSPEAATFALSTMYMHWSLIPYAFYTLVGLTFAITYYNLKQPFSLGSLLYPLFGDRVHGPASRAIDMISLFSLVTGMAASLGAGILIISGGLGQLMGVPYSTWTLGIITIVIVSAFVISAASGLMKGIRLLSDINAKIFIALAVFVFICGPTLYLLKSGGSATIDFISNFFTRSLIGVVTTDTEWAKSWTIFYWGNWLAWTPVTALFLGRISIGYTVKQFIQFNLLMPSLFACLWMMVFSGSALYFDSMEANSPLYALLNLAGGSSRIVYAISNRLPLTTLISYTFLGVSFLSYVTAADSNTTAMSSISSGQLSKENAEPALFIKIIWGVIIGLIAWTMVAFSGEGSTQGLDGIKMLSNIGGFPVLFFVILVAMSMAKLIWDNKLK
jgi:choline-glycine betaine transporter